MQRSIDKLFRLIGPAAHSPRANTARPYSPRPGHEDVDAAAIREELNQFFTANMPLIRRVIAKVVPFLPQHDRSDMLGDTLLYLIRYAIPRYEPSRGTKLTTFVWACTRNHLTLLIRNIMRRKRLRFLRFSEKMGLPARDTFHDRRIERLADRIAAHPREYLTRTQTGLMEDITRFPESTVMERAARLGHAQPSSTSMLKSRLRDRLIDLAEEVA